jgi:excisionase family DNA binding protein
MERNTIVERNTIDPVTKTWYRPEEATAYLGIGRTRIYALLTAGEIPSVKVGRTRHIRRADLDKYMERRFAEKR